MNRPCPYCGGVKSQHRTSCIRSTYYRSVEKRPFAMMICPECGMRCFRFTDEQSSCRECQVRLVRA